MTKQHGKVAIVTGANQGLGLALVKGLARRLTSADTVYLCSRSFDRGQKALANIKDHQADIQVVQLDITIGSNISDFARYITETHGGVDLVASNAAARISPDIPQSEQVRSFVSTNNHGSCRVLKALMPLLRDNARYIIVASDYGRLSRLPRQLWPLFDTKTQPLDDIETTMDRYVEAMEAGTAEQDGWPDWINIPSKIGQVATARIAARMIEETRPDDGILINAVCPGLIDTDASRPWFNDMSQAQTPDEAARALISLLLTPAGIKTPQGELVQFGRILPWLG
ncbi:SDR family NAD(P)-dependent oxidoreductase [Parendozoicomonas haliclonae]|uniref:3-ketoacyl-(Acyl-carrier-protein) reductase n=1 Tax=Parendozoicomonas haliclonae TaxID=1960125 RepID=A0A1X7ATG2_9GAMM|nr:SDR family NAD(P)-dependent oxidoreductase [Parendozoicomonas haliclonae]SMA50707.1 3-ketoacyl-(acyl-carrier-protein) reductase [Parendozoicomonas haliclonae]